MNFKDPNVRRKIIMKHYSKPDYKGKLERNDIDAYSQHCVDELHVQFDFENDILKNVKWDGVGCATFKSSSDILLGMMIGKSLGEMKEIASDYENMINKDGKTYDIDKLGELAVFKEVKIQLNRLYCANIASQAILKYNK